METSEENENDLLDDPTVAVERCLQAEQIKQTPTSLREFLLPVLHLHCGRGGIFGCALGAKVSFLIPYVYILKTLNLGNVDPKASIRSGMVVRIVSSRHAPPPQ